MTPVTYRRASSIDEAIGMTGRDSSRLLGGGTNLVDLMRKGVERPSGLIDVTGLSDKIEVTSDGGLLIGAAARNSAVAEHPLVRTRYPLLARAILTGDRESTRLKA